MEDIRENVQELKPRGTQESEKKTAYDSIINSAVKSAKKKKTNLLQYLGLSKNKKKKTEHWWKRNPRKRRKDRTSEAIKSKVSEFYLSQEVSREVPNKKDVLCVKGEMSKEYVQKHIMTMTSTDAYHAYKTKYPEDKIGFSTFKKLKPPQVRRVSETSRKSCLCQICCNIALKCEALKTFFLEKATHRNESLYLWPDNKEVSWEPVSDVNLVSQLLVKKVHRRILFSFDED
jgi:hypothetical protein